MTHNLCYISLSIKHGETRAEGAYQQGVQEGRHFNKKGSFPSLLLPLGHRAAMGVVIPITTTGAFRCTDACTPGAQGRGGLK